MKVILIYSPTQPVAIRRMRHLIMEVAEAQGKVEVCYGINEKADASVLYEEDDNFVGIHYYIASSLSQLENDFPQIDEAWIDKVNVQKSTVQQYIFPLARDEHFKLHWFTPEEQ